MIEAYATETQGSLLLSTGLRDNHNGLGAIEDGAGPGGILATETDVDATREMALRVFGGIANVKDLCALVAEFQNLIECDWLRTCSRFVSSVARSRVLRMAS